MDIQVSVHDWLKLPIETRLKLREIFKVPKSEGAWVENNQVRSDGTTYKDLQVITIDKMQEFLNQDKAKAISGDDFVSLFHATVEKIQEDLDAEMEPTEKPDPNQFILEEWAANVSRMQRQAQSLQLMEQFNLLISKFITNDSSNTTKPAAAEQGQKVKQKRPGKGNGKAKKVSA